MTPAQLKRLRAKLDLSQRELAVRLGVTPGAVAQWETGVNPIPTIAEIALAKITEDLQKEEDSK